MMSTSYPAMTALAAMLLLAGCNNATRGIETVNQPVVSRADYAFDVTTGPSGLAYGEADRLAGWMRTLQLRYGDRVALDDPSADPGVRAQVAAEAQRYGLFVDAVAPVTPGALTPGTARVVISRLTASVPNCPNHSGFDASNFDGHTHPGFGCAVNGNLASMIANPADLVRGQPGSGTTDPANAVKAIDSYRKAPASGAGGIKSEGTGGN
ncbi:CpaD family pilus assembly protein [Sphingomonas sp. CJ99]